MLNSLKDWIFELLVENFWTKIVSVLIAMILWFIVLGSRNEETTKEIPIDVITSADVVVGNEIPNKVSFRLSGPKAFLRRLIDREDRPIQVNLSGAKPGLVTYRFFSDNIVIPLGVKVLTIHPTEIILRLEKVKKKTVPVRVETVGLPPEGYEVVQAMAEPSEVSIRGSSRALEDLKEVKTSPVDVSDLNKSVETSANIETERSDVKIDGDLQTVKVVLNVQPVSANFRIRNVPVEVLTQHKFELSKDRLTVFVRAAQEDLKGLDQTKVFARLDLQGRGKGKYKGMSFRVMLPEKIGLVKVVPERLDVTLY